MVSRFLLILCLTTSALLSGCAQPRYRASFSI